MLDGESIRLVIADDHPVYRDGLAFLLARYADFRVVGTAGTGEAALELCRANQPHVALVDLRMGGMSGFEVLAGLARELPDTRAIVLSGFDTDEEIHRAVQAGAAGYLVKNASPDELAAAIRQVSRGETCIPAPLVAKLASSLHRPQLTPRQREVMLLIAAGLSNQEIGNRLGIVEGTVKIHVKAILAKLGARDRTQAVSIAHERGIVRR